MYKLYVSFVNNKGTICTPVEICKNHTKSIFLKRLLRLNIYIMKSKRCCGLCGKHSKLVKTDCCGNWICNDEHKYVLFSYARNSCSRNHRRFTLCGYHHVEGHKDEWQTCKKCRNAFETEDYVWYGTNEYNFTKLENPPKYEPTRCYKCGKIIILSEGGYSHSSDGYGCYSCSMARMEQLCKKTK